jgi:hypothetical protein
MLSVLLGVVGVLLMRPRRWGLVYFADLSLVLESCPYPLRDESVCEIGCEMQHQTHLDLGEVSLWQACDVVPRLSRLEIC